jgi:glycine/D-amino acid oxidase-like deaminating enzyme
MAGGRVVVVGAGVMGAWSAHWLVRRGLQVTLVDQRPPGSVLTASGGETRVTRSAHGSDEHYPRWQRRALAHWRELAEATHQRLLVETGVAWFAHVPDGFEAESLATLTRLGIPSERLEQGALADRWPQLDVRDLAWVLHEPEGAVIMARRAVGAAIDRLLRDGGALELARVVAPDASDGRGGRLHRLRLAEGGILEADAWVLAAGPWLGGLVPALADQLAVTRQELVLFATPPGDGRFDAGAAPTWADYDAAFYGLPSIEGRGFKVASDWAGPTIDPDREERRLSDERVAVARDYLRRRFPALAPQPVSEGRVCQYTTTLDTHFVIDRDPRWENVWVVGGGSGHAFKHGPVIGEYTAALVVGDREAAGILAPPDERFALRPRRPGRAMRTSGVGSGQDRD